MTEQTQVLRTETLLVNGLGAGTVNLLPPWTKYASDFKRNREAMQTEEEMFGMLQIGSAFAFTFVRENLKQGKDPNNAKDYDYWFGIWAVAEVPHGALVQQAVDLGGVVTGSEAQDGSTEPVGGTTANPAPMVDLLAMPAMSPGADKWGGMGHIYGEWHTSRRTALMQAVEQWKLAPVEDVLIAADKYFVWLRGMSPNVPTPEPVAEEE